MDQTKLLIAGAGIIALISLGGMVYVYLNSRRSTGLQNLFRTARGDMPAAAATAEVRERLNADKTGGEYDKLRRLSRKHWRSKQQGVSLEERYFHAGIFSARERREFERLKYLLPAIVGPVLGIAAYTFDAQMGAVALILGLLIGIKLPSSILDRKIERRGEDLMFYLPLVIEQVAIGVSSSLDIGPCLQRVVAMADERDSHNAVTELVRHAQNHVKSGISLEEALVEIGTKAGHTELKHTFMALSQVAKHGGEISHQLQELADAVAQQRETKIDAKIKKLELEATAPVALVFVGFILILLSGFFIQIKVSMGQ